MKVLPMLSLEDTKALLSKSIFADLEAESVSQLHPLLERQSVVRGELIRKIGEPAGDIFIVETGTFVLCDADHSIVASRAHAETIGVFAVLFGGPQIFNTQAYDDSTLLQLDSGSIKMLERSNPALSLHILRCLRNAASPRITQVMRLMTQLYQS